LPSRHDIAGCLADIVENLERIKGYVAGMDRDQFKDNGLVRDAVERCLERVCEAAHRLGADASTLMPGQPWGDIRGMGTGCAMLTTASASTSCGIPCGAVCQHWRPTRGKRLKACRTRAGTLADVQGQSIVITCHAFQWGASRRPTRARPRAAQGPR
jgi:hypothetical protein